MIILPTLRGALGGLDSATVAFAAASGATDLSRIDTIAKYLKAQSLWDNCRLFPFKSAQNKGSGTTVYGIGGWTSNNIALVNGPTWGTSGVAFDATDDRGTVTMTGIKSLSELYVFDRQNPAGASLADSHRFGGFTFGDASYPGGGRILATGFAAGALTGETTSIGINVSGIVRNAGTAGITWSAGASTQLVSRFASVGYGMWKSKIAANLNLQSGTQSFAPSEANWTYDDLVNVNILKDASGYILPVATTRVALLLCKTSLTTGQRETLTDMIDSL